MATQEERSKRIEQSIMRISSHRSQEIRRQADEIRRQALSQAENEVLEQMYDKIQTEIAKIRQDAASSVAKCEFDTRQTLFRHREEIESRVFDAVRQRLLAFVAGTDYVDFLRQSVAHLAQQTGYDDSCLFLREQDLPLAEELIALYGHTCRVQVDPSIRIGGVRLENMAHGVAFDETLDARLEEQHEWFHAHSGLSIT